MKHAPSPQGQTGRAGSLEWGLEGLDAATAARFSQPALAGTIARRVVAGIGLNLIAHHAPRIAARDPGVSDRHLKAVHATVRGIRAVLDLEAAP